MQKELVHEIELFSLDKFRTLLDHEVNRSKRNKEPLTLIHLAIETDSKNPYAQHGAEIFAINVLNLQVRETDIPCKKGNEFMVLIPSTDEQGGRIVCERLEMLFNVEPQEYDKVSFKPSIFIGMATLSGDRSTNSQILMDNAEQALKHALEYRHSKTVVFSEL